MTVRWTVRAANDRRRSSPRIKSCHFSTKSAFCGINPLSWMKSLRDEICLAAGSGRRIWFHLRWHTEDFIQTCLDFILQSRISLNLQGLQGWFLSLQAFFVFNGKKQIVQFMGYRSIYRYSLKYSFQTIKVLPNMLFYVIINSMINKNLTER